MIIRNCYFTNNYAYGAGGALAHYGISHAQITNCIFEANEAVDGGAVCNLSVYLGCFPKYVNCIFVDNVGTSGGGAVLNFAQFGTSSSVFTNCIFKGNSSQRGGAIASESLAGLCTSRIVNCLFYDNRALFNGPVFDHDGYSSSTISYSLFGLDSVAVNQGNSLTFTGNNILNTYPKFVDTTNLRGPDGYFITPDDGLAIQLYSPAIDAGDPNTDPSLFPGGPDHPTDIVGQPRFGSPIDIGPYEAASIGGEDPPNCTIFSPSINEDGMIILSAEDLLTNPEQVLYPVTIRFLNQWGGLISTEELTTYRTFITREACSYLGLTVAYNATNAAGNCFEGQMILSGNPGPLMSSAWQSTSSEDPPMALASTRNAPILGPNISRGKINVYCGYIPAPEDHWPVVADPCSYQTYDIRVRPDWVMPLPCNVSGDTARIIFRTWEAEDKSGRFYTLTDTIVVFRLPTG